MMKKLIEAEVKNKIRENELTNATIIEFEKPKFLWRCTYIYYGSFWREVDGEKKWFRNKQCGTYNVRAYCDDAAMNIALSQLYELLNAERGSLVITSTELVGTIEGDS